MSKSCHAVVVTYKSEHIFLEETIRTLLPQIDALIVVDNSPSCQASLIRALLAQVTTGYKGTFEFIENGDNVGIAAAQNIGIGRAIELGADFVIFSDHDTSYPENTVPQLMAAYEKKTAESKKVGAIGPAYVNSHSPDLAPYFIVHEGFFSKRIFGDDATVEVSYLIASGLMVPVEVLRIVGGFRSEFFIDWVDIEWCLRAKSLGYSIFGCDEVRLRHRLGDYVVSFMGYRIPIHSPFRHYYMTRNAIWLARRNYIGGIGLRLNFIYIALVYAFVFPVLARPSIIHFKACWRGFIHGFKQMRAP